MTETPNFVATCPRPGCAGSVTPEFDSSGRDYEWSGWECSTCWATWSRDGFVTFKGLEIA